MEEGSIQVTLKSEQSPNIRNGLLTCQGSCGVTYTIAAGGLLTGLVLDPWEESNMAICVNGIIAVEDTKYFVGRYKVLIMHT